MGARVRIASSHQSREVRAGDSYASDSERILHFGLGSAGASEAQTVDVEVRWPDGFVEEQDALSARETWLLRRGSAPVPLPPR